MNYRIAVIGSGGGIGEALVGSLASTPAEVVFLDVDRRAVDRAAAVGADARVVDPSDGAALDREDIGPSGPPSSRRARTGGTSSLHSICGFGARSASSRS